MQSSQRFRVRGLGTIIGLGFRGRGLGAVCLFGLGFRGFMAFGGLGLETSAFLISVDDSGGDVVARSPEP